MSVFRKILPGRNRPVYEEIGDEVSVEGTICQAAQAIDIAGKLAAEQGNSSRLLETAESWTKLADFIMALSEHADKKKKEKKDAPFGFQPAKADDESENEQETEKDEDVRSDED